MDLNPEDYPSNSIKNPDSQPSPSENKAIEPAQKKVKKVVQGQVIQKKKSIFDSFFGDSMKTVGEYILYDVLIPAAKDTISDMINNGINMLLYGDDRSSRSYGRDRERSSLKNYNKMYVRDRHEDRRDERNSRSRSARYRMDDILIPTKQDASEILEGLVDMIDNYGHASVADFYDLAGITGEFTDNKYGWDNLSRATIQRVRDGWIINLPKPFPLE